MSEWISTAERLPAKPGKSSYEHVECLIVIGGRVQTGLWNCEHECWDDDEGDDFLFDATTPTHWMPFPAAPESPHPNTERTGE